MRRNVPFVSILAVGAVMFLLAATGPAAAQGGSPMGRPGGRHHPGGLGGPGGEAFERFLYPPELVLSNQEALALTGEQIAAIKKLLSETHEKTLESHVDLQRVTERLSRAVEPAHVDEAAVLAAADQAMALETQIKKAHLGLMVRIKNLLSEEQQSKLAEMKQERRADRENRR